jgi:membrane protease subunit HflC
MRILGIIVVIVVLGGAIIGPQVLFAVDETQLAIVTRFGEIKQQIRSPGLKIKTPFIDNVIYFDKRLLIFDAPSDSLLTQDKKRLIIDVYARARIIDPGTFFRTVRTEDRAAARAIDIISSELRREIALDDQLDVIKETREAIMNRVREGVRPALQEFGIEIVDVRIKRADFPDQIATSVYERMKAERKQIADRERAEGAEFDLEKRATVDKEAVVIRSEAQKEAQIIRGEAEAEAITIFAEALQQDPEFYEFQRALEAYKEILSSDTTIILDPNSELLKFLQSPGSTP